MPAKKKQKIISDSKLKNYRFVIKSNDNVYENKRVLLEISDIYGGPTKVPDEKKEETESKSIPSAFDYVNAKANDFPINNNL